VKAHPWISSLLLDALGIPAISVPASRSESSHRLTSVSFQDVFAYCYLDQDEIDQETVKDKQSYGPGAKRPWTFELLHGIIDSEVAGLEVKREELAQEREDRQQQIATVERFVEAFELPVGAEEIRQRLAGLDLAEQELTERIATIEGEARVVLGEQRTQREQHDEKDAELRDAAAAFAERQGELEEVRRAGNQLQRDIETLQEGERARLVLEPMSYLVCPRCEQDLDARRTSAGHCVVCQQPENDAVAADNASERQLVEQLEEPRALGTQLEGAVADLRIRLEEMRSVAAEQRAAVAVAKDAETAPFRASILELQERLGALRGERQTLAAGLPIEHAVRTEHEEIEASGPVISEIADQAQVLRGELAPARARVEEVSQLFSEILHEFGLPWLQKAEVDPGSYLPLVNGLSLRKLSSGGMKTTTNIAYYLAVFVIGLRDRAISTPNFLMLDSIRKDSGSGNQDLARSDRIYSYLQTLQELRGGSQSLARDFQLIVVDNDLPQNFERTFNTLRIDPSSPLVRGVE